MRPIPFPEANCMLVGPSDSDDILPLHCMREGDHVFSCWELSDAELAEIIRTKRLWLVTRGATQPPMCMLAESPFPPADEPPPPDSPAG